MRTSLLIFALSLAFAYKLCVAEDESCLRTDGKSGYWVLKKQCPKILDMLRRRLSGIPFTAEERIYINHSRCPGSNRLVCCEEDVKVIEGIRVLSEQNCGQFGTMKTIGGKEVELMSRPWMVYLTINYNATVSFTCGGTLISNRYVLTAAHCFKNGTLQSVHLGEHNLLTEIDCKQKRGSLICAPKVQVIQNNEVFQHEEYSARTKLNDIALVKLSTDVLFSNSVRPICLPLNETLQQLSKTIDKFFVAGWGELGRYRASNVLTETIVSNLNKTLCDRSYSGIPALGSTQLCAGDIGRDSCSGDSGGPLAYVTHLYNNSQRFVQFGITSYGSPNCGDGHPGVYTNVGNYIRWIAKKIAKIVRWLKILLQENRKQHRNLQLMKNCTSEISECPVHKNGFVCCEDAEEVAKGVDDLNPDECGEFGTSKTIGGREIALMSRPWMTLLYIRDELDNEDFTCGGTLINKRYVLTAAHCFTRKTLLYVRLGEHKISQGRDCTRKRGVETCAPPVEDVEADRVYIHENYSSITGHNDIALIKLSRDVEFKESIGPICLPVNETIQQSVSSMELFHVTGWGKTEVRFASDVPLETVVRRKDIDNCQKSYRRQIIPAQLCAGGLGRDACNGDSGGPLAYVKYLDGRQRFVQFGIVSFGSSNCGDGNPGVYTNVGSYIRWIAYKIATK
ncbi:serine protease grass-like [Drosophila albomicans]|uniref:Serine protease grass-like n=1 Tax=Drosophila albomicans TaxID=7291 RepID=A0A6P8XIF6_DROAB|nr:serine protease grass-like [Drosophila albomicans]